MRSKKAGESGHFVRTISLSWRNAVVYPCKNFSMFPLWSVGEGTNLKMRFFLKILCAILEVFRPTWATNLTDVIKILQDERDLNWPNSVLLHPFGIYRIRPPPISWEASGIWQCRRHLVANKRPAGDQSINQSAWTCYGAPHPKLWGARNTVKIQQHNSVTIVIQRRCIGF